MSGAASSLFSSTLERFSIHSDKTATATIDDTATEGGRESRSSRRSENGGGHNNSFRGKFALKRLESAMVKNLAAVSEIEKIAQKKGALKGERFKVIPDDEYPDTHMNREELRREMNKKSIKFHQLKVDSIMVDNTSYNGHDQIGEIRLEILQCFGLPTSSLLREVSAYCTAVCGPYAFKTDIMPPVANPMWLCRMRRACAIPIYHGFARLYIGCFDNTTEGGNLTDFIGRIVLDLARLRPMCTYDVTIPLRQSAHVFERQKLGSIRVRFHLTWKSERDLVLSYLPKKKPKFRPNEEMTINCLDDKSFRDVALVVHGKHMPGRFSMRLLKGTMREINFTQIHIMRYIRKQEIYNLRHYIYPLISSFVFLAWMHCVYAKSVQYIPGHFITYILLHLWKNYAHYCIDSSLSNGFLSPTFEELFSALVFGNKEKLQQQDKKSFIEPLDIIVDNSLAVTPTDHIEKTDDYVDDDYEEANTESVPLARIAETMRKSLPLHTHTHYFKKYTDCFLGTEAVDFLVAFGFAYTRDEAVILGRKLERETKLFEHVGSKVKFDDEPHRYYFLQYDTHKYIIKGHEPQGKKLFQALGFFDESARHRDYEQNAHVPFPFATGVDHPRFTVKQSLVVRSNRGRKLLKEQETTNDSISVDGSEDATEAVGDDDDVNGEGRKVADEDGDEDFLAQSRQSNPSTRFSKFIGTDTFREYALGDVDDVSRSFRYGDDSDGEIDDVKEEGGIIVEEKILSPPPNQDIGVSSKKGDKTLPETLQETRHKAHSAMLHVFNDRTYRVDQNLYPADVQPDIAAIRSTHRYYDDDNNDGEGLATSNHSITSRIRKSLKIKDKNKGTESSRGEKSGTTVKTPYDRRKDECDKILGMNKYSSSNLMMKRIGVVLQPLLEIAQAFLFLFRALFNIFTWQDPILSFWVAMLGPVLVIVFHFTPWRLIFGIGGIVFIGPQNWIIRVMKERKGTYEAPNFDKSIKKREQQKELNWEELPYFSKGRGDHPVPDDPMHVKQVIVPYSKFKYSTRFFDWPPEPEYAKVYASPPPTDDTTYYQDRSALLFSGRNNQTQSSRGRTKKKQGGIFKRMAKSFSPGPKHRKSKRKTSRYNIDGGSSYVMSSLSERKPEKKIRNTRSSITHYFKEFNA